VVDDTLVLGTHLFEHGDHVDDRDRGDQRDLGSAVAFLEECV